jgi:AraC family transcriptional regulator of adaptative response/methylated-DNA-[protein]-cysteine methyltransferase
MPPHHVRDQEAQATIRFAVAPCALGTLLVAQSGHGLCAIFLGDDAHRLIHDLEQRFPHATLSTGDTALDVIVTQVIRFVESPATGLNLPLDIGGTAFQQRVWAALQTIPAGSTASYTDIAHRIGSPSSVRAVASACAANALAVAIPCHRVVRRNGDLSGYRWGVSRKRELLTREAQTK